MIKMFKHDWHALKKVDGYTNSRIQLVESCIMELNCIESSSLYAPYSSNNDDNNWMYDDKSCINI